MNLPDYQSFLSGQRLTDFWQIVKWLLFFIAPVVMIFFAVEVLKAFYQMIIGFTRKTPKNLTKMMIMKSIITKNVIDLAFASKNKQTILEEFYYGFRFFRS